MINIIRRGIVRLALCVCAVSVCSADLLVWPNRNSPSMDLREAERVSSKLLKSKFSGTYYAVGARLFKDKSGGESSGTWNISYLSKDSDVSVIVSVKFPKDFCVLARSNDVKPVYCLRNGKLLDQKEEENGIDPFEER